MVSVKKKLLKIIPCLAVLIIFSAFQFVSLKTRSNELFRSTGLIYDDEKKIREENKRAKTGGQENQNMLSTQEKEDPVSEADDPVPQNLKLHAVSSLLLDATNNRVLFEKNGFKELPMASTTKIMTCIVTLENASPDEVVTISANAARMPDVQLNSKAGEQYYLGDLLYSLMLESHNDTAVAIAEHVGGSVEGFAAMMNEKAKALGCEHTHFVTPNGLDAPGHHTTARDLAVIASYAIKNEQFIKITNTSSHEFHDLKGKRSFHVSNKDRFLYMMDGAIGVKTGFTNDAGYCFVGAIKRPDRTLISVVLGCGWPPNKNFKWMDTKELMDYGVENYENKQIFENADMSPVFVHNGQQRYEALALSGNLSLLMRKDEKVKIEYDIPKLLEAPVKADSQVGKAKYYINGTLYTEIPIHAIKSIDKIDYKFCLKKLLQFWSLL